MLHSLSTSRSSFIKKFPMSRKLPLLLIFLLFLLLIWTYQPPSKPTVLPTTIDCKQSLIESDGFFCEPNLFWNERKRIHRWQDKINKVRHPSDYFFATNWRPTFHCSYADRIGAEGDGGKWVCDACRLKLQPDCLTYSVGSNGDFSFETELKKSMPHCEIHTFDRNLYECPKNICTFHQITFGNGTHPANSKDWQTILRELNHTNRFIDILKIDIEGTEYSFFPQILNYKKSPAPRQIIVELHPTNVTIIHDFFDDMRDHHYAIFVKEENLIAGPYYYEFGFIKLSASFSQPN